MATESSATKNELTKSRSTALKLFGLIGLVLLLLIPLAWIGTIIQDRQNLHRDVVDEIANSWSKEQLLVGPILSVPYGPKEKGNIAYLVPKSLKIEGNVATEVRKRGIFEAVVYKATLNHSGEFDFTPLNRLGIPNKQWHWDQATVLFGVSDNRGIQGQPKLVWKQKPIVFQPGASIPDVFSLGMHANVDGVGLTGTMPFQFELPVLGTKSLRFLPISDFTDVTVSGNWSDPSFQGKYLPLKRTIKTDHFSAAWSLSHFSRASKSAWTNKERAELGKNETNPEEDISTETSIKIKADENSFGVDFYQPVDVYQQSLRAAKYGILFLSLTFLTFFLFEALIKSRIHVFHYLLIGLALSLFYLLLVSFSEMIQFDLAYLGASIPTISLITWYGSQITNTGSRKFAFILGALLTLIYAFLYFLLQMEDYALLVGSLGLFVILFAVMVVAKRIDWYGDKATD